MSLSLPYIYFISILSISILYDACIGGHIDATNILEHKRSRRKVDYVQMSIAMFGTVDDDDADIEDKDFEDDKGHEDGDDGVDEDENENENQEGENDGDDWDEDEDLMKKNNDNVVNNASNEIVSDDMEANRRVLMDEKNLLMTVTHIDDATTDAVDDIDV